MSIRLVSLVGFALSASLALMILLFVPAYSAPESLPASVPEGLTVATPWDVNLSRLVMVGLAFAVMILWLFVELQFSRIETQHETQKGPARF